VSKPSQKRSSRRIVEAEDIAKLDIGISVVAVVVLGKHDSQRMKHTAQPFWRFPPELARMSPPYVQLTHSESDYGTRPGNMPDQCSDDEIWYGTEQTVEEHRGIGREHGVVEVRAPAIVMRPQVQRKPKMLRNVIEERRGKVAGNERDDKSGNKRYTGGGLVE
jgi:hypothetical protein